MSLYFSLAILCIVFLGACTPSNNKHDGIKTIYYPNSAIKKQVVEYHEGRKNGYLKEYFRDGKLKAKQYYKNDTLTDTTLIYYPSGILQTCHTYKVSKRHGCWRDYNPRGVLISEIFFKEDLLDSVCTKYSYRTTRLLTRIRYKNGVKDGMEELYYPSGKIRCRQYYSEGQICMGTEEWYQSGRRIDNDFEIIVREKDAVQLENTLTYFVRLEDPRDNDIVYQMVTPQIGNKMGAMRILDKKDKEFYLQYNISKGGFVMETVVLTAYRKTAMGNTVIKTKRFNAASNNF